MGHFGSHQHPGRNSSFINSFITLFKLTKTPYIPKTRGLCRGNVCPEGSTLLLPDLNLSPAEVGAICHTLISYSRTCHGQPGGSGLNSSSYRSHSRSFILPQAFPALFLPSEMGRLKLLPASKTQGRGGVVLQHRSALPSLTGNSSRLFWVLLSTGLVLSRGHPSECQDITLEC